MTKLTPAQKDVLTIINDRGPLADYETAVLLHQRMPKTQASSGVRTRRKELQDAKLVRPDEPVKMRSGRSAQTFVVTAAGRRLV